MSNNREKFSSKLGFILAAAGSAVGIGNLVGFPVNAAKNGGGAFLFVYAIFVLFICLPVMMAEMAIGRKAAKEPVGTYSTLSHNQPIWRIAGALSVITPFMIAVFYTVITVWILCYLILILTGQLSYLATPESFNNLINDSYIFVAMAVLITCVGFILVAGIKNGIEKAATRLMPALFVMLIALVVFILTQDNAWEGVKFFVIPDFSKITPSVINSALSQAFFSLSLGMGIFITYGSYIDKKDDIVSSAKLVALTDTLVAFIAGLMILPAIFSFNPTIQTDELSSSSVSLIFTFLPKIFLALEGSLGYFLASCVAATFFSLVFFAALTSLVSILEVPVSYLVTEKKQTRKKALFTLAIVGGVFSMCTALSFGMVEFFTDFISYGNKGKSFFDVIYDVFYDTILPLNGFLLCLFVSYRWKSHRSVSRLSEELSQGNNSYMGSLTEKYVSFALSTFIPLILLSIFIQTVAQKYFSYVFFSN